jgi:hypothetical protein
MAVVESSHPAFGKRPLVLFLKASLPIRQGSLGGHTLFGVAQDLGGLDAVPVAAGEERFDVFPQRMVAVGKLAGETVFKKARGFGANALGVGIGALEPDMEPVVAFVDPGERFAHAVGRHEDAKAFGPDGALDGSLPAAFGGFDLDQFGDIGQFVAGQAELAREEFAKGLEVCRNVRVRSRLDFPDLGGEAVPGFAFPL